MVLNSVSYISFRELNEAVGYYYVSFLLVDDYIDTFRKNFQSMMT